MPDHKQIDENGEIGSVVDGNESDVACADDDVQFLNEFNRIRFSQIDEESFRMRFRFSQIAAIPAPISEESDMDDNEQIRQDFQSMSFTDHDEDEFDDRPFSPNLNPSATQINALLNGNVLRQKEDGM